MGLTYAVGDIHGRLDLLEMAADAIMDDLNGGVGRVICLGDYVDRGPDSKGVVEFLMRAQSEGAMTCLKGNHEDMMVSALRSGDMRLWLHNGGDETLRSYEGSVPDEHLEWLSGLPIVMRDARRIYVHAGLMPGVPLEEQDADVCLWIRNRFLESDADFGAHVVHGHTPQHEGKIMTVEPELLPHRTNLDTGAVYTGILTVAVFDDTQDAPLRIIQVGEQEE